MVICTSGNAVIVKDDGRMISYKHKCPCCGHVDNQVQLCSISSGSVRQSFSYSCSSCHEDLGSFEFERL